MNYHIKGNQYNSYVLHLLIYLFISLFIHLLIHSYTIYFIYLEFTVPDMFQIPSGILTVQLLMLPHITVRNNSHQKQ